MTVTLESLFAPKYLIPPQPMAPKLSGFPWCVCLPTAFIVPQYRTTPELKYALRDYLVTDPLILVVTFRLLNITIMSIKSTHSCFNCFISGRECHWVASGDMCAECAQIGKDHCSYEQDHHDPADRKDGSTTRECLCLNPTVILRHLSPRS